MPTRHALPLTLSGDGNCPPGRGVPPPSVSTFNFGLLTSFSSTFQPLVLSMFLHSSPISFPCHTSEKSSVNSKYCHTSKTHFCKSFVCHRSKTHRGCALPFAQPRLLLAPSLGTHHYLFSFHALAHSFALFCTHAKLNSFPFKQFRTLYQNTRVGGRVPSLRPSCLLNKLRRLSTPACPYILTSLLPYFRRPKSEGPRCLPIFHSLLSRLSNPAGDSTRPKDGSLFSTGHESQDTDHGPRFPCLLTSLLLLFSPVQSLRFHPGEK